MRIMCRLVMFTNADGTVQPALCFFDLEDDGTVARIADPWSDPHELPANRKHAVERYL
jgi:hypothetical protein